MCILNSFIRSCSSRKTWKQSLPTMKLENQGEEPPLTQPKFCLSERMNSKNQRKALYYRGAVQKIALFVKMEFKHGFERFLRFNFLNRESISPVLTQYGWFNIKAFSWFYLVIQGSGQFYGYPCLPCFRWNTKFGSLRINDLETESKRIEYWCTFQVKLTDYIAYNPIFMKFCKIGHLKLDENRRQPPKKKFSFLSFVCFPKYAQYFSLIANSGPHSSSSYTLRIQGKITLKRITLKTAVQVDLAVDLEDTHIHCSDLVMLKLLKFISYGLLRMWK